MASDPVGVGCGCQSPVRSLKPSPRGRASRMLADVDVDELQHALGGIVLEAAYMERVLRTAFSALVGSKYAAVVDGRLTAAALIEDCERITRYHTAITQAAKEAIWTALRACHGANRDRSRVIPRHLGNTAWQRDGHAPGQPDVSRH